MSQLPPSCHRWLSSLLRSRGCPFPVSTVSAHPQSSGRATKGPAASWPCGQLAAPVSEYRLPRAQSLKFQTVTGAGLLIRCWSPVISESALYCVAGPAHVTAGLQAGGEHQLHAGAEHSPKTYRSSLLRPPLCHRVLLLKSCEIVPDAVKPQLDPSHYLLRSDAVPSTFSCSCPWFPSRTRAAKKGVAAPLGFKGRHQP